MAHVLMEKCKDTGSGSGRDVAPRSCAHHVIGKLSVRECIQITSVCVLHHAPSPSDLKLIDREKKKTSSLF